MGLFLVLIFLAVVAAFEDCQTPTNQPGKCVLINHCPHLLSSALQNQTETSKDLIKRSHCGFQSMLFPKVCCPDDAIKFFHENGAISQNQYSTKCGLHTPESPSDPWLALLEYENGEERSFLCGGVLINKRYVLTAAHCVKGRRIPQNYKLSKVHLGAYNTDTPLIIPVDGSTAHEDYDPDDSNQYNDIGLVRLKKKVNFKEEFVRPICVPLNKKKDFLGKTLQVTGYKQLDNTLKKRDGIATVWNNSECHLTYNLVEVRLRDSQICAGGKRQSSGHSKCIDFGGILMHVAHDNTYSAVGILSLQPPCCDKENNPKVYTKVASYMEWIISNLKP